VYAQAAYRNADLVEETVEQEAFDCDYARNGWIQAREDEDQEALMTGVEFGRSVGAEDWTTLSPDEVLQLGGMQVDTPAGFSQASATFHPARWVWCLLGRALASEHVGLYTRTKVEQVDSLAEGYLVVTDRGSIRCRNIINATESYTAALHPHYSDLIHPVQTQAAFGEGGPADMPAEIALSGKRSFFGRHPFQNRPRGLLVGSDATRVKNHQAGRNAPSRFITSFSLAEVWRHGDPRMEWHTRFHDGRVSCRGPSRRSRHVDHWWHVRLWYGRFLQRRASCGDTRSAYRRRPGRLS
jgi:glycine/D-amino acid oxidase-like deaminating enzyme